MHWQTKENAPNTNPCRGTGMVETVGLEPMTPCMSSKCSNQLSYASIYNIEPNAHCECFFIIANISPPVNPFPLFSLKKPFIRFHLTIRQKSDIISLYLPDMRNITFREEGSRWSTEFFAPYDGTLLSFASSFMRSTMRSAAAVSDGSRFFAYILFWNE